MDGLQCIMNRQSCRSFLSDEVKDDVVLRLIRAANQAPSPLNGQPWNFTVITNTSIKTAIADEAVRYKKELIEKSNWKWLEKYELSMLNKVPVMIVVSGDPLKSGADRIMEETGNAWREACGAAIENMMIAACAEGLASLWFTMFNKSNLKLILKSQSDTTIPLAVILLGKAASNTMSPQRKLPEEVVTFLR